MDAGCQWVGLLSGPEGLANQGGGDRWTHGAAGCDRQGLGMQAAALHFERPVTVAATCMCA